MNKLNFMKTVDQILADFIDSFLKSCMPIFIGSSFHSQRHEYEIDLVDFRIKKNISLNYDDLFLQFLIELDAFNKSTNTQIQKGKLTVKIDPNRKTTFEEDYRMNCYVIEIQLTLLQNDQSQTISKELPFVV